MLPWLMRVEGVNRTGGDVLLLSLILYKLYVIKEAMHREARALGRNVARS